MTVNYFDSFISYSGDVVFRGVTPPSNVDFYAILCANEVLRTENIATVVGSELAAVDGYARQNISISVGTYYGTDQRHEYPVVTVTFTATTGDLTFSSFVILADAVSTVGSTGGKLVAFSSELSPITILVTQSRTFTVPVFTKSI